VSGPVPKADEWINEALIASAKKMRAALQYSLSWNSTGWSPQTARTLVLDALAASKDPLEDQPIIPTRQAYEAQRAQELGWRAVNLRYRDPSLTPRTLVVDRHERAWLQFAKQGRTLSTLRVPELHELDHALLEETAAADCRAALARQREEFAPYDLADIADYAQRRVLDVREQILLTLGDWFSQSSLLEASLRERDFLVSYDRTSMPGKAILRHAVNRRLVGPGEVISAEVTALSRRWTELTDALTSAHTDPLRLQGDLVDALHHFTNAVWSDSRLPGPLRESLQWLYQRVVQPLLKRDAFEELCHSIGARVSEVAVDQFAAEHDCSTLEARETLEAEAFAEIAARPVNYRDYWRSGFEAAGAEYPPALGEEANFDGPAVSGPDATPNDSSDLSGARGIRGALSETTVNAKPGGAPDIVPPEHVAGAESDPREGSPPRNLAATELSPAAWREAGATESDLVAMRQAGGYAAILAHKQAQLDLKDLLDHLTGSRIVAVRNALRELGWDGPKFGKIAKEMGPVTLQFDHTVQTVGAGQNVVSVVFSARDAATGGVVARRLDEMTEVAAQMAQRLETDMIAALQSRGVELEGDAPGNEHQGDHP
jgi:hypothetical protein